MWADVLLYDRKLFFFCYQKLFMTVKESVGAAFVEGVLPMLQREDIHRVLRMQQSPVVDRLQNGGLAMVNAFWRILYLRI